MIAPWQSALVAALNLPADALVNQRVPKKLLVENGAPTTADKRKINDGIEEIHWLAALKPNTIGVPEYLDDVREYQEIAVLSVTLRSEAKADRLAELIHRAIPYPLFLVLVQGDQTTLSLAHKRKAQNEADKFVLDGDVVNATVFGKSAPCFDIVQQFLEALPLSKQPRTNLLGLYQGWIDTLLALLVSQRTGVFRPSATVEDGSVRQEALRRCEELETKIVSLRNAAVKEKQMARRVELNLEIKGLITEMEASKKLL
ncbi:DUF4391 domain-containing protein [Trichlorobacter lovleyi]|uniref:DUF4391 domain-containing protein n=1 Tax=Trichlorobacter lovleyi TaxID=313985 RepID=UPI003D105ED8